MNGIIKRCAKVMLTLIVEVPDRYSRAKNEVIATMEEKN
jgi:hypothetical protein